MNSRDRSRSRPGSGSDWDELDAVFDALPQPVIAFDTDGAARRANAAVRSALGIDPSGLDADGYERLFMGFNPRRRDGSPVEPAVPRRVTRTPSPASRSRHCPRQA